VQVNKTNVVQQWAERAQKGQKVNTEKDVPLQYADFKDIFSEKAAKHFPPERDDNHKINFTDDALKTFPCKIYPISKPKMEFLCTWVCKNLEKKFIRESKLLYACLTFFIKKKNGDYCIIKDYQQLNQFTVLGATPLLLITLLIEKLHGKTLFTKFDIQSGYHNIRIKEGDQYKAGFKTSKGQFEPMVINFGLQNTLETFQRVMNKLLCKVKAKYGDNIMAYMDDLIIATKADLAYHQEVVCAVLAALKKHSFFLKPEKCKFGWTKVEYLEVLLEGNTVSPDPSKVMGLQEWPTELKNVSQVQSTLGVLRYQHAFIKDFTKIAKPLTSLLKKGAHFFWDDSCSQAIKELVHCITSWPVLIHPDPCKPFELEVNASNYATGAILF
jgi:reverse transcriptase-like protein